MNTYGVLGRYIPAFGRVVGRMQYDLFHAYTVDAHTLFVVSNLRRFMIPRYDHELPDASRVMQQLPKSEIAYLAALFHDIAKGRGGDHSELGAVDAEAFCLEQGLSPYDARLVAWLVRNHLRALHHLPEAGHRRPAGDQCLRPQGRRRDAPRLPVRAHLRRRARHEPEAVELLEGLAVPRLLPARQAGAAARPGESRSTPSTWCARPRTARAACCSSTASREAAIVRSWTRFTPAYFLQHSPEEIAWHTRLLAERDAASDEPLVALEPRSVRGTTAALIFARPRRHGFARTTAALDQLGLNIVDARITPTGDGFSLDLYHLLEDDGAPITDSDRQAGDRARAVALAAGTGRCALRGLAARAAPGAHVQHARPRSRSRSMSATAARCSSSPPGTARACCARSARCSWPSSVELHAAKIMTVGERAEDVFYLTDFDNRPLAAPAGRAAEGAPGAGAR